MASVSLDRVTGPPMMAWARVRKSLAYRLGLVATAIDPGRGADQQRALEQETVGGEWDLIGRLQFDFLVAEGLRPEDAFLDVGCGVLRGGLHFIRYLDAGNYYGIDSDPMMISGAKRELANAGVDGRGVHLRVTDSFDVNFDREFDVAIAQSVFTHLPLNAVYQGLAAVSGVLRPGGRFYATFFRSPAGPERFQKLTAVAQDGYASHPTTAVADPYHYAVEDFAYLCQHLPLAVDDIGDWGHPRGQQMLRFTRTP
jgi:SAM-dependent methyltransferase